jgi:transposase
MKRYWLCRGERARVLKVGNIVDIRRLRDEGLSKSQVAKRLGLNRRTVSKYWDGETESPSTPEYKERASVLAPWMGYIKDRLKKYPELSAKRLYDEIRKKGYSGSERTVRREVARIRPADARVYTPQKTLPGEQAQADWGHVGTTKILNRVYQLYCFVFTMSWSRLMYVEFVVSLNMATFLASLARALEYVGGVPQVILFDNAKTVVSERVGTLVRFNEDLMNFALHAGFTPRACWINDPESKGKVESGVKHVKKGFFYGLEWTDVDDLNLKGRDWFDNTANNRVHGTTREIPWERMREERQYLKELPRHLPTWVKETRRATKDRQISVDGNRYFVPLAKPKGVVTYRRYEDRIEVVNSGNPSLVLPLAKGYREVEVPDTVAKRPRRLDPLQVKFEGLAPSAPAYLQGLGSSRVGHLREQMEKIVALGAVHTSEELERAMHQALNYRAYGFGALKGILKHLAVVPGQVARAAEPAMTRLPVPDVQVQRREPDYYENVGWRR